MTDDEAPIDEAPATSAAIRTWIEGYVRAWRSNDAEEIGALFTDDATYLTAPFREPRRGRAEIVAGWLEDQDGPDDWQFEWAPLVAAGDVATVTGVTRYADGTTYSNLWVIYLAADGRASRYTEWFMEQPPVSPTG